MSKDVGTQGALAQLGARGLVVGDLLRRNQQRGDGVDQGRFARTNVSRQQGIIAAGQQRPHAAMKGAPVVKLQPVQAKARALVRCGEIQRGLRRIIGAHG